MNILENESFYRLTVFLSVFAAMALLEIILPKRKLKISKKKRWLNNISLTILNSILIKLIFPIAAVGVSLWSAENSIGFLNSISVPFALELAIGVVFLDFSIYWQHRIFHKVSLFWRLHRVHHTDQDLDVSSGSRFHTIEIFLSMLIKMTLVVLLGIDALAVILFEIILNALAMFNHANVRFPKKLESLLRIFVVTPDMHRIHHSVIENETNSNYGFCLSVWDRIFKSYKNDPQLSHLEMEIGLKEFQTEKETTQLLGLLLLPFKKN